MAKALNVTELLRNFSEYISRVTYKGESFTLMRGKLKVAELKPVPLGCTVGDFKEFLKRAPLLDSAEKREFKKDIESAGKAKAEKLKNPWG